MKLRYVFLILVLVVPFVLVALPGIPQWLARTTATSVFLAVMTGGVFWYALSSKTQMIRSSGKLSQPQYDDVRPTIERNIRVVVLLFGVFCCIYLIFPLMVDVGRLMGGAKPQRTTDVVKEKSVPLFGLWFLEQSVRLSQEPKTKYALYFCWEPLQARGKYEFLILPRSRVIVEFREVDGGR
jgi:hypothetical protein